MNSAKRAVDEWKAADDAARAAEARLKAAWDAYETHKERAPGIELMEEVSRLRAVANHKLTVAMAMTSPNSQPGR